MSDFLPISVVPEETMAPSGLPPEDRAVCVCLRPSFLLPVSLINPSQNIHPESRLLERRVFHLRSTSVLKPHLTISMRSLGGTHSSNVNAGRIDKESVSSGG